MEKPANTEYPIQELLRKRWSPLSFDPRPIPREFLLQLFEAARWAASSYNEQPWTYIVGIQSEHPEQFELLANTLFAGNAWAKNAPVLALSVAKTSFSHNGEPNRVAVHDIGAASANLALEATNLGISVHQMGGFDVAKAREILGIPSGFEPVAMLAIGYEGDPNLLEEGLKKRELAERKRKSIGEFVFTGKWNQNPL